MQSPLWSYLPVAMLLLVVGLSGCSSNSPESDAPFPAPVCYDEQLRPIDCATAGQGDAAHETLHFNGTAQLTGTPATPGACTGCEFSFRLPENVTGLTIEAIWNDTDSGSFHVRLDIGGFRLYDKESGNPLFLVLADIPLGNATLTLQPDDFPLAFVSVPFKAYVTIWTNALPPTDWSYLAGDR